MRKSDPRCDADALDRGMNEAAYSVHVVLADGQHYAETRNVTSEQAASTAHALITRAAARYGGIRCVTITLGDYRGAVVWEWQYARGVVSE